MVWNIRNTGTSYSNTSFSIHKNKIYYNELNDISMEGDRERFRPRSNQNDLRGRCRILFIQSPVTSAYQFKSYQFNDETKSMISKFIEDVPAEKDVFTYDLQKLDSTGHQIYLILACTFNTIKLDKAEMNDNDDHDDED